MAEMLREKYPQYGAMAIDKLLIIKIGPERFIGWERSRYWGSNAQILRIGGRNSHLSTVVSEQSNAHFYHSNERKQWQALGKDYKLIRLINEW